VHENKETVQRRNPCLFSSTYKVRIENKGRNAGKMPALCGNRSLPWSDFNAEVAKFENAEVKRFLTSAF